MRIESCWFTVESILYFCTFLRQRKCPKVAEFVRVRPTPKLCTSDPKSYQPWTLYFTYKSRSCWSRLQNKARGRGLVGQIKSKVILMSVRTTDAALPSKFRSVRARPTPGCFTWLSHPKSEKNMHIFHCPYSMSQDLPYWLVVSSIKSP